jgi:hypothetical protein
VPWIAHLDFVFITEFKESMSLWHPKVLKVEFGLIPVLSKPMDAIGWAGAFARGLAHIAIFPVPHLEFLAAAMVRHVNLIRFIGGDDLDVTSFNSFHQRFRIETAAIAASIIRFPLVVIREIERAFTASWTDHWAPFSALCQGFLR